MKILVLNCGSSSLKFQLIDMENEERLVKGNFERIGGLEYLAELPDRVPTTANVEKYIKIVS